MGLQNEKRPVVLGMSNSTHLEIKDGLAEGDQVVLNPRAVIPDARAQVTSSEAVDVNAAFGSAPPGTELAPGGGPGADGGKKGGKKGKGKMDWSQADKDGDGKLSRAEVPERLQESFSQIDSDGDGFVTSTDIQTFFRSRQGAGGGGPGGPGVPDAGTPADGAAAP
jgi:hypothetical protein